MEQMGIGGVEGSYVILDEVEREGFFDKVIQE